MKEYIIPSLVLLLGSYDPDTRALMEKIKEHIARKYPEHIYAVLLDDIDIIEFENHVVLLEKESTTAYLFNKSDGKLMDIIMLSETNDDLLSILNKIIENRYKSTIKRSIPVLEKLDHLARFADLVLLLRHKELTRGGEYIELIFLLEEGLEPRKLFFVWNQRVPLSTMLKEALNSFNFNFRYYEDEEDLLEEVSRIIYYNIISRKTRP